MSHWSCWLLLMGVCKHFNIVFTWWDSGMEIWPASQSLFINCSNCNHHWNMGEWSCFTSSLEDVLAFSTICLPHVLSCEYNQLSSTMLFQAVVRKSEIKANGTRFDMSWDDIVITAVYKHGGLLVQFVHERLWMIVISVLSRASLVTYGTGNIITSISSGNWS